MNIFLDANVLVSVLNKEYPVFTYSSRIFSLTENKRFNVFTSPVCMAIAFYFSEKKSGTVLAKRKMEMLASKIYITDVGEKEIVEALRDRRVIDFEDGIEYFAAYNSHCKCIITEDVNDFHFSSLEVLNCSGFIEKYAFPKT